MAAAISTPVLRLVAPPASRPAFEAPVIEELPAHQAAAWDAYVLGKPRATLYHLHAWRRVAQRAYELEAPFLVARDARGGAIVGALPLFRVPRPFSPYLTNGLFGAYGDVLADEPGYAAALSEAAVARIDQGNADYVHLKLFGGTPPKAFDRRDIWVDARLALGTSEEETWKALASAMRTKIRHAQKAGFTSHVSREIDGFYDVLSENMLRKGAPIYGRCFFETLVEELGPRASVLTLEREGKVVSGALLAWVNGVMYVPFASSRPAVFSLKANQLLWWEIARHAHSFGLHTLDFGSSMRDSSGLEFKKHWGTSDHPIASYIHARQGVAPALTPGDSAIARGTVKAWSHLPRSWAEALGPRVMRWIA
jgi:FemAB-related protein (PEP-CTERM system-associated)